jgi:hypothetical protein
MAGTQVVGNIGMYFAAYRLSQMGWNVMPTSRNARGVDLLAYDMSASRFHGIQVKALSKRNPVPLGKSVEELMGDWWIIVAQAATLPVCFGRLSAQSTLVFRVPVLTSSTSTISVYAQAPPTGGAKAQMFCEMVDGPSLAPGLCLCGLRRSALGAGNRSHRPNSKLLNNQKFCNSCCKV